MPEIEIGIATARRAPLAKTVAHYIGASQGFDIPLLIAIGSPSDFTADGDDRQALHVLLSPQGLPAQRNTILAASNADILIFFDDDFLPSLNYVEQVRQLFRDHPDVMVATGDLIADGARTGGLELEEGMRLIANAPPGNGTAPVDTYGAYGCNMAIRMKPVRLHNLRFDENLPLYGWQEDIDFSRQMAPYGRIVRSPRLRGVHLGTKRSGRSPGKQLGYSQVANPYYLICKGTMSKRFAWRLIRNNLGGNILRFLTPEPTVDRRGRLLGNIIAIRDIFTGRCHPRRILEF